MYKFDELLLFILKNVYLFVPSLPTKFLEQYILFVLLLTYVYSQYEIRNVIKYITKIQLYYTLKNQLSIG